mmetsp:Transcript_96720/g.276147  ORF Transcript_96720/g.276147 Transcript_96720/m.276147 type:complete len:311 (+) Transcript_96720:828-1760(+)
MPPCCCGRPRLWLRSSADSALPSTAAVASGLSSPENDAAAFRFVRVCPRDPVPPRACLCMSGWGGARHFVERIWNGSVVDTENVRGTPSGFARTTERICEEWNGRLVACATKLVLYATNLRNCAEPLSACTCLSSISFGCIGVALSWILIAPSVSRSSPPSECDLRRVLPRDATLLPPPPPPLRLSCAGAPLPGPPMLITSPPSLPPPTPVSVASTAEPTPSLLPLLPAPLPLLPAPAFESCALALRLAPSLPAVSSDTAGVGCSQCASSTITALTSGDVPRFTAPTVAADMLEESSVTENLTSECGWIT